MNKWMNDSLCCEDAKENLQGKETLFVGLLLGSKTSSIVIDLFVAYSNVIKYIEDCLLAQIV